jgi:tetratricopeptide (TPR) repeat protein
MMKSRLLPLLLLICLAVACTSKKEKAQQHFKSGKTQFYRNDWNGALEEFNKAVEYDPSFDQAWYFRGNVKFSLTDLQGAMEDYNTCIELNSGFAEAYNNRAQIKFIEGDKDGSCADWKKAHELGMENLNDRLMGCM